MLLQGWCGYSHLGEEASIFIKSNTPLAYDPVIPLTCLPKKHENVHTTTSHECSEQLYSIPALDWKQPKWTSPGKSSGTSMP